MSFTIKQKYKLNRHSQVKVGCHLFLRKPSEGLVFEFIGKYHKHEEERHYEKQQLKTEKQRTTPKKDEETHKKRLLKFIDKNISPKKEQHDITNMHEIEHITEEIEKGKGRK